MNIEGFLEDMYNKHPTGVKSALAIAGGALAVGAVKDRGPQAFENPDVSRVAKAVAGTVAAGAVLAVCAIGIDYSQQFETNPTVFDR